MRFRHAAFSIYEIGTKTTLFIVCLIALFPYGVLCSRVENNSSYILKNALSELVIFSRIYVMSLANFKIFCRS